LGCAESNLALPMESRLPHGLILPSGYRREDVSVRLSYSAAAFETGTRGVARMWLVARTGRAVAETICEDWEHPRMADRHNAAGGFDRDVSPQYVAIACDGAVDVIEHGNETATFHVTDDPTLQNEAVMLAKRLGVVK
jgi:hypothetical protein